MWTCLSCSYTPKVKAEIKLRYPILCRCGEWDYGRPNDTTIEWCDDPPDAEPTKPGDPPRPKKHRGGPGTELKRKLSWFASLAGKKCKCNKIARQMDREGPDWCEANIGHLVECLRESHAELPSIARACIPFVEPLVRETIRGAIEAARLAQLPVS